MAKNEGEKRIGRTDLESARGYLAAGDYKLARQFANRVLADASQSASHKEAMRIDEATRVDRAPLTVGAIVAIVLLVLFWWALSRGQGTP